MLRIKTRQVILTLSHKTVIIGNTKNIFRSELDVIMIKNLRGLADIKKYFKMTNRKFPNDAQT